MLSLIFGVANETETAVQYEDMIKCWVVTADGHVAMHCSTNNSINNL